MLRASSCHSCVQLQASPLIFTNVAAGTELALSLSRAPHTADLSLWSSLIYCYHPQQSCEGYVFTGICLSTGGGCLPQCMLGYYPHPRSRHPPGSRHTPAADTTPQEQTPPKADTPLGGDTPSSRHTPPEQTPFRSRYPPEQTPPQSRHPLRGDTTPGADTHTPSPRERRPLLRTVRILLECILVSWVN